MKHPWVLLSIQKHGFKIYSANFSEHEICGCSMWQIKVI